MIAGRATGNEYVVLIDEFIKIHTISLNRIEHFRFKIYAILNWNATPRFWTKLKNISIGIHFE